MGELGVFENVTLKPLYYLSGPDGAGKTTALGMAVAHLTAQGDRVKTLYGLNRFLRYVGKRTKWAAYRLQGRASATTFRQFVARGGGHEDRDPGSLTWRLRKGTLLALGLADVQLGYALALGYRALGYTVVVETSPFDPLGVRTVPVPTLYFLLEGSPEAIRARKPELNEDEIRVYYARINALLRRVPQERVVRLCADRGLEELERELTLRLGAC